MTKITRRVFRREQAVDNLCFPGLLQPGPLVIWTVVLVEVLLHRRHTKSFNGCKRNVTIDLLALL